MKKNESDIRDIKYKNLFFKMMYLGNILIFDIEKIQNIYVFDLTKVTDNKTIILQNRNNGTFTDWGDGVIDTNVSHTYEIQGTYTVKTRQAVNTSIGDGDSNTQQSLINCIKIDNSLTSCNYMFSNCINLVNFNAIIPNSILSCKYMFQNCSGLTTFNSVIPNSVTSTSYMFYWCSNLTTFNSIIPNTVTSCNYMFYWCNNLNSTIIIPTNVINCSHMFHVCTSLTTIPQDNINLIQAVKNGTNTICTSHSQCYYMCSNITSPDTYTNLNNLYTNWFDS